MHIGHLDFPAGTQFGAAEASGVTGRRRTCMGSRGAADRALFKTMCCSEAHPVPEARMPYKPSPRAGFGTSKMFRSQNRARNRNLPQTVLLVSHA